MSEQPLVGLASMVERLQRLEGALRDCELSGYEREANRLRMAVDLLRWRVRRQSAVVETAVASSPSTAGSAGSSVVVT